MTQQLTLRQQVAELQKQVFSLVNMIFAIGEVLEDKGFVTKADIMARAQKVSEQRTSGLDHKMREAHREVLDKIYIPPPNGL